MSDSLDAILNRRLFLKLATIAPLIASPFKALAMGFGDHPQGIRDMKGEVFVNDQPAIVGTLVRPGDTVRTGPPESSAAFVIGGDAYLMRSDTRIRIDASNPAGKEPLADLIRIISGKVLMVFRSGERRITTPTAIAGIRGTAVYLEATRTLTYLCTCYGSIELASLKAPESVQRLTARHHEHPRYISADGTSASLITEAPMKNHSDAELIYLEKLVGRVPPFMRKQRAGGFQSGDGNGGGGGY